MARNTQKESRKNGKNFGICLALAGIALAAFPTLAHAQTTLPTRANLLPTKNTREINLAGTLLLNGGHPYTVSAGYGLFLSPAIEVGATGLVAGANHASTSTAVGGFADYYFTNSATATNPLLPFVGLFAGYSHNTSSDASLGAQGGVKYFFNPNVAGDLEYDYRSTRHGNGTNEILLGFSTFFH